MATLTQRHVIFILKTTIHLQRQNVVIDKTTIPRTRSGLRSSSQCKQKDIYEGEIVAKITKSHIKATGTKSTTTRSEKQKPANHDASQHQASVRKTITVALKSKSIQVSDEPNASKLKNIQVLELAGNRAIATPAVATVAVATVAVATRAAATPAAANPAATTPAVATQAVATVSPLVRLGILLLMSIS